MGPLLANELFILGFLLIIVLKTKDQDPQVTGMRTGQSPCNAPVGCQVPFLPLHAMNLNKGPKFLEKERLLEM